MTEWRDISSAPRDLPESIPIASRALLLFALNICEEEMVTIGFWTDGEGTSSGEAGWWDVSESAFCHPTHWTPLPTPPITSGEPE